MACLQIEVSEKETQERDGKRMEESVRDEGKEREKKIK